MIKTGLYDLIIKIVIRSDLITTSTISKDHKDRSLPCIPSATPCPYRVACIMHYAILIKTGLYDKDRSLS